MATQKWAIALIVFMTFITSTAQIFYKLAAVNFSLSVEGVLLNWPLWIGAILYVISSVLMVISFKGGDISVLYPLIALSYVWVSLASPRIFPADSMNTLKWCGVVAIIFGVSLIGLGGKK
jgi:multidrug transporter EmrE-like cation transporter